MPRINVLVAATSRDVKAEGIAAAVASRSDMTLVGSEYSQDLEKRSLALTLTDADTLLHSIPSFRQCAVVLVGPPDQTAEVAERWLAERPELVVLQVELVRDAVRIAGIALRDPSLDSLLDALRELVDRVGTRPTQRISRVQLRAVSSPTEAGSGEQPPDRGRPAHPLFDASIDWVHQVLRDAVERVPVDNGDVHGLSVTRATLLQSLDTPAERGAGDTPPKLVAAAAALDRALAAADSTPEPLRVAARVFDLGPLEFRMMLLGLAPELDPRYQRCAGFLLDDMGRRVGTLGLYTALLGVPEHVRRVLADGGALARWRLFEAPTGQGPAADEPLRLDPYLAGWLLGEGGALAGDPRVRRALRPVTWAGAELLARSGEQSSAEALVRDIQHTNGALWTLLGDDHPAGWRALIELGAAKQPPIRVEAARITGLDLIEIEESALRLGRLARLTGAPLIIDVTQSEQSGTDDDSLRVFLGLLADTACNGAVICRNPAYVIRLLGATPDPLIKEGALGREARVSAVRAAAAFADAYLTEDAAAAVAAQYPMYIDDLEHAMHLARRLPIDYESPDPRLDRFVKACKQVASEGVSHLAQRIEPIFELEDVVLPADRKQQLHEIVDNVRLAPTVLDHWKFRDQLPYGRGVTALFFGPSGTGKTMAAMGIARRLGVQILRLDLSLVVSKYIGETEKHIDRVFTDAQRSGSAILIDEADALLGKRSEVKDAHDRYANIEVAYLLQRMEAYEGLAILTTNQKQNLDTAFLRRIRFMVDFPRPDVEAREKIWRHCLPTGSYVLDDAAFRQLARRLDVTGGHIRQITLRAAFLAAAAGELIGLKHISQAARAEFAKLGMPPVELDLGETKRAA